MMWSCRELSVTPVTGGVTFSAQRCLFSFSSRQLSVPAPPNSQVVPQMSEEGHLLYLFGHYWGRCRQETGTMLGFLWQCLLGIGASSVCWSFQSYLSICLIFQSVILLPMLYYLQSAEVASLKKSLKALSAEMAELRVLVLLAHDKALQSENSSAIALPTPESQSTTAASQLIHLPAATSWSCSSHSGDSMLS